MKAHYTEKCGDVRVVRPLCYVRESETKAFVYAAHLPVINENCPACFEVRRSVTVKKLLAQEESLNPSLFGALLRTLLPLMDEKFMEWEEYSRTCCRAAERQ